MTTGDGRAELRLTYLELFERLAALIPHLPPAPVDRIAPVTRGNALSVYFRDSEDNQIELSVDAPAVCDPDRPHPIPLGATGRGLMCRTEETARKLQRSQPVAQWKREMASRMSTA